MTLVSVILYSSFLTDIQIAIYRLSYPATLKTKNILNKVYEYIYGTLNFFRAVVSKFLNRNRNISTSQLNALLRLHLKPINVIISHGS